MNCEKVADHITDWLKTYALNAGTNGFVIGISGGIDSAVTSALCARTGLNVKCVVMSIHQHPDHETRAWEHIDYLKSLYGHKVTSVGHDLTRTFEQFNQTVVEDQELSQVHDKDLITFHLANTRARLRMTTLYFHSGLSGYLVAGTGNKVEDFGIGFFTKYGDGGVDISPIGDLLKSEVYELAEYLGVPASIQKAAPTDGLFGDTRTDEDQIGATYDELEWAMSLTVLDRALSKREGEVLKIYNQRHQANAHKMQMPPICDLSDIK